MSFPRQSSFWTLLSTKLFCSSASASENYFWTYFFIMYDKLVNLLILQRWQNNMKLMMNVVISFVVMVHLHSIKKSLIELFTFLTCKVPGHLVSADVTVRIADFFIDLIKNVLFKFYFFKKQNHRIKYLASPYFGGFWLFFFEAFDYFILELLAYDKSRHSTTNIVTN